MNIWLCPVKPSWLIIKRKMTFGAPAHAAKIMKRVEPDDLLIFHVFKPTNGIVAVGRVISDVYEDNQDIWGKDRYPLRVRVEFVQDLLREDNPVPLSSIFNQSSKSEVSVEPFLKNVWITKVSKEQYKRLLSSFKDNASSKRTTKGLRKELKK